MIQVKLAWGESATLHLYVTLEKGIISQICVVFSPLRKLEHLETSVFWAAQADTNLISQQRAQRLRAGTVFTLLVPPATPRRLDGHRCSSGSAPSTY